MERWLQLRNTPCSVSISNSMGPFLITLNFSDPSCTFSGSFSAILDLLHIAFFMCSLMDVFNMYCNFQTFDRTFRLVSISYIYIFVCLVHVCLTLLIHLTFSLCLFLSFLFSLRIIQFSLKPSSIRTDSIHVIFRTIQQSIYQ